MDIGGLSLGLGGANTVGQILYWAKWGIIMLFIMGCFVLAYFWLQYKYKVVVFERGGSGALDGQNSHYIRKVGTWERARLIKNKSGMITHWKLLFAGKKIEPVELKHIYPGNYVFLYKVEEGTYVPTDFSSSADESTFNPIPQHIRRWQTLEIQQAAQDYQKQDFWTQYFPYIVTIGTVLSCCVFAGIVIYFAFDNTHQTVPLLKGVVQGLNNVNVIPGAPN